MIANNKLTRVRIDTLLDHPLNGVLYSPSSAEENASLAASLREHGQGNAIIVCGIACSSPPGTILSGHRRRNMSLELGWTELDAIVVDGLSELEEEKAILRENLLAHEHRKMSQRQMYEHETRLRALSGRRQGVRSDLDASKPSGNTDTIIAAATGTTASEIRTRRKVFGSAVSIPELQDAVETKVIPLTKAANWIRYAEGLMKKGQASLETARQEVAVRVEVDREEMKLRTEVRPGVRRKKNRRPVDLQRSSDPVRPQVNRPAPSAVAVASRELVAAVEDAEKALARVLSLASRTLLVGSPPDEREAVLEWLQRIEEGTALCAKLLAAFDTPREVLKGLRNVTMRRSA